MEWAPSHQDDKKSWDQCILKEEINIKVDKLAKASLITDIAGNEYVDSGFPGEHTVSTDGRKVTESLRIHLKDIGEQSKHACSITKSQFSLATISI